MMQERYLAEWVVWNKCSANSIFWVNLEKGSHGTLLSHSVLVTSPHKGPGCKLLIMVFAFNLIEEYNVGSCLEQTVISENQWERYPQGLYLLKS